MKRFYRSRKERVIAGVCGGLAEHLSIDPVIIRIGAVVLCLFGGVPIIAYLVAIFAVPLEPLETEEQPTASSPGTGPDTPQTTTPPQQPNPLAKEEEKARMAEHIRILGILYIALGIFGALVSIGIFALLTTIANLFVDIHFTPFVRIIILFIAGFILLFSLPGIFTGLGLMKHEKWSRVMGIILGILNLFHVPFGTALGIYTLWALSKPASIEILEQKNPNS